MAKKDIAAEQKTLEKKANLEDGEKLINVYSKIAVKAKAAKGNPLVAGKTYHVHPEHVEHLKEKGFIEEVKGAEVKTEVPDLNATKETITIQA